MVGEATVTLGDEPRICSAVCAKPVAAPCDMAWCQCFPRYNYILDNSDLCAPFIYWLNYLFV